MTDISHILPFNIFVALAIIVITGVTVWRAGRDR
jgi:hypothetical protein